MRQAATESSRMYWAISIGLSAAAFISLILVFERWTYASAPLFLVTIAPVPLVLGFISRSWWEVLSPIAAWLLIIVVFSALVGVQLVYVGDVNGAELFSRLVFEDSWERGVWPMLPSAFVVGKLLQPVVRRARHLASSEGSGYQQLAGRRIATVGAKGWRDGVQFAVAVLAQASLTIVTLPMRPPVLPPVLWLVLLSAAAAGLAVIIIVGLTGRRWAVLGVPALTVAVGIAVLLVNTLISGAPIYIS